MTKITGTNTYIDVELDGRTARIAGEMIVGGFVCYKSSMKNWLVPENEPLTEDDKKEIIQKVYTESNRKNGRFAYGNNF